MALQSVVGDLLENCERAGEQERGLHILVGQHTDSPRVVRANPSDDVAGFVCEEP